MKSIKYTDKINDNVHLNPKPAFIHIRSSEHVKIFSTNQKKSDKKLTIYNLFKT